MPQSLTEAFQGSDYTTVAHKHMYLHQSHTYIHAPLECPRKRRLARTQSIPTALHWDSPHHSSHSVHSSSPTAATAELQGGQAVQTRPHGSRMSPGPPAAEATAAAAVDHLATPAHSHSISAPITWPTWPRPSPNPSAGWAFGPAAAPEALPHTSSASPTTLARPPNAVIRSLHTAIPARARDHLQRTRSPHELYSPTRSQGPTGGKLRLPGGAAKHHCAQEPTLGPKRRCADMAANPANRRAHVRGLRAPGCAPLRRFQTATGVRLTAPAAACVLCKLPSPGPCLAYARSRPAENRLGGTYRPPATTSRRPRWPPTPSRRPLHPGRSTGYRCAGKLSLRSRFPSCRSRLSGS